MNITHRILTVVILCMLVLSACVPATSETPLPAETPKPSATTAPPTMRPEVNVALNKTVRVSASWVVDPPERAVDGSVYNWWGAGGVAPQWIEVDLQGLYTISRIRVINQGPGGLANYRVLGRGVGYQYQVLHTFDGVKTENQTLEYSPNPPWTDISVIRIEIPNGSGWVGLREIFVYSREDPKPLPVAAGPATPPFQSGVDWDTLEPVNADNAIMMQPLSMLGRGTINELAWSPDGKTIAAASTVGVWLYDPADLNAPPRLLEGHTRDVLSVAFSQDGTTVLSASQDGTVKQWDLATGSLERTIALWNDFSHEVGTSPREKEVWSMAFSPDRAVLAAGYYDGALRLWNLTTGSARTFVKKHDKTISILAFSPDGMLLVSSGVDRVVNLWDVASSALRATLPGDGLVQDTLFSPDGKILAFGSSNKTIQLWDTAGGESRAVLSESSSILSLAFSGDGMTLASSSLDGALHLWDVGTGSMTILHDRAGWITDMAFNPAGTDIIAYTWDGVIQLWEIGTGNLTASTPTHTTPVNAIAFSPDGKILAAGGDDSRVRLWDVETNRQIGALHGHLERISGVAFSPDGRMLASSSFDRTVRLWDVTTGSQTRTLEGHGSLVRCVAFSPDGKLVASGSTDKTVRLWDIATGTEIAILEGHTGEVEVVDFSRDGLWLLSGSSDQTIRIWEVATGKEVGVFDGNKSFVLGAAFSPDASLISTVGGDFIMRAYKWEVKAGQLVTTEKFPEIGSGGWDMATTFSPDGALIASACNSTSAFYVTPGEVHLYRSDTGFPVSLLRGHTKRVLSVAFSPDGKLLASGSADGTVRLWGARQVGATSVSQTTTGEPAATPTPTPAPPTPSASWRDEFDGSLAEGWRWVREHPSKWNLTENPGFLRIYDSPYEANGKIRNLLLRDVPGASFIIETHVIFEPKKNFQFAGLTIYQNDGDILSFGRAFCDTPSTCTGNGIYFDYVTGGTWVADNFATSVSTLNEAYLRLERRGNTVTAFFSYDGTNWFEIGSHTLRSGFLVTGIGLIASGDFDKSDADTPADFDYFEITELP